jgi:hypothetical protein
MKQGGAFSLTPEKASSQDCFHKIQFHAEFYIELNLKTNGAGSIGYSFRL